MSTKNPFVRERMERKKEMLRFIVRHGNNPQAILTTERVIGAFSWKWGLRSTIIKEYLKELEMAELITTENNIVKPTECGKQFIEEMI